MKLKPNYGEELPSILASRVHHPWAWTLQWLSCSRLRLFHFDLVVDLAPAAVLRGKLQDPLVLRIAIHGAGENDALIIDIRLHINTTENWIVAEQVL